MKRRDLMAGLGASLVGVTAAASSWPSKPIRMLLGYTPGGAADITAREINAVLGPLLGQPLVVDYKAGASGTIAAAEVLRSAPDGHTLALLDNAPLTIVPALRNTGYDPMTSFSPIAMVTRLPQVLVATPALGVNSLRELLTLLKQRPGQLNFGSGGAGGVGHLAAELLKQQSGTFAVHVPYRGGGPTITALMADDVQFAFLTASATAPFIASGKLKALGVASLNRLASMPMVPTVAESGLPGFDVPGWFALMGPANMPEAMVLRLREALAQALATPALVNRLELLGQLPVTDRADPRQTIAREWATWKKLFSERKITVDS